MKLRLCTLDFKKLTKVQEGESIKTRKKGDTYTIIELGVMDSFGKPHWCGVISKDIINIAKIKKEIESLENSSPKNRVEWFSDNFPKARIVKIELSLIFDQLKDNKRKIDPAVVISNAVDLNWNK